MTFVKSGIIGYLLILNLALAESPPSQPSGAQYQLGPNPPSNGQQFNPGTIKVLDENFFSPSPVRGKGGEVEMAPNGREYAADPDYNSEQREQWLQKCAPYREKDTKLFRECFQQEKDKMRLDLRQKFDAVERRQGGKKMSIEDLIKPNAGSGGFD